VGRNLALAAVAGGVTVAGSAQNDASALVWLTGFTIAERLVLAGAAIALALFATTTWLALQVLRQQGRILLRLESLERARPVPGPPAVTPATALPAPPMPAAGLPVGAPAPEFNLPDLDGRSRSLEEVSAGSASTLLLFMDPECGPCAALLPEVAGWRSKDPARLGLVIVSRGSVAANRDKFGVPGLSPVLLEQDFEVAASYQAHGTPSAVVVTAEGTIGSPVAAGAAAIRTLVRRTLGQLLPLRAADGRGHAHQANGHAHPPRGVPVGQPAPRLALAGLDGRPFPLATVRDRPTVLLFWNPGCGFCQAMRSDILAWEAAAPPRGPALVVVSSGSVEQSRNEGFRGAVLVDPGFTAGQTFGAAGTPSAVLVDKNGRVGSPVAEGRQAVLALLQPTGAASSRSASG
jgi:thiol-disulfide isomerase/thioredoxin